MDQQKNPCHPSTPSSLGGSGPGMRTRNCTIHIARRGSEPIQFSVSPNVAEGSPAFGGSHTTVKELENVCSRLFDMKGNTFTDEMARREAKGVEVLPSPATTAQAIDERWLGRSGCASSRQTQRPSLLSPSVISCRRARWATGNRGNCNEMSCWKPQLLQDTGR